MSLPSQHKHTRLYRARPIKHKYLEIDIFPSNFPPDERLFRIYTEGYICEFEL